MSKSVFAVCVLIKGKDDKYLSVSRNQNDDDLGLPGGKVEPNEDPKDAIIREVKEEVDLEIYDLKPVFTKIFTEEKKYGVFFIAKVKEPYKVKISSEHQNFKWFKKNDLDKIDFWQPFYKKMLKDNL